LQIVLALMHVKKILTLIFLLLQNQISATYPDGHTEILFTPLSPFETPEVLDITMY